MPESALVEDPEPAATDLALPASDDEPSAPAQTFASDAAQPARPAWDVDVLDGIEQSLELDQPELAQPESGAPAASFADPEFSEAAAACPVHEGETGDAQEPVECFSAMHQPISFEEPQIEDLVVANEQTACEANESVQGEFDATADVAIAIEVATIEPVAPSNEETKEPARADETSEPSEDARASADVNSTPAEEEVPNGHVQDIAGEGDTPATTPEQTEIVALPVADASTTQPARGRGRATTIAGLGAIAATLAIALHPPIADELLSLPWQDMLHMHEILDKLSELKRFFAFA